MKLHLFNPNSKEYKKIEQIYKHSTCMVCNLPMKTHSLYFFSFDKEKAKDGEMHGYGEYTFAGGRVLKGYFYEDKFIPRICTDMGLAEQTESFGDCVVELIKKL